MKLLQSLLLVVVTFCDITTASAQEKLIAPVDSLFTSQAAKGFMGDVLVATNGHIVYQTSMGYKDYDKKLPNNDSTCFSVAAITSVLTATCVLQLCEKQLISLDARLKDYFPNFPYPNITVRHLLCHTSGLPSYELFAHKAKKNPDKIFVNGDIIPMLKEWEEPLYNEPGDEWHYSALDYCLLTLLVEQQSGMSYESYLSENIFKPSGMRRSYVENGFMDISDPNRANNYEFDTAGTGGMTDVRNIDRYGQIVHSCSGLKGQGGLVTNVSDLLAFDQAYFTGKLLTDAYAVQAMTPARSKTGDPIICTTLLGKGLASYGLGWNVGFHPQLGQIVWHEGGKPGVKAIYVHSVRNQQTVIILENTRNYIAPNELAHSALFMLNNLPEDKQP
jgi:CubicO group peptidase (beta-lactamase class C family)